MGRVALVVFCGPLKGHAILLAHCLWGQLAGANGVGRVALVVFRVPSKRHVDGPVGALVLPASTDGANAGGLGVGARGVQVHHATPCGRGADRPGW